MSTDHNYRQEEHKGITIKRINELMQRLILIRERNAGAFNNIMKNGIPKPTGAKLTANLVATPLDDPTPHQAKSRAQLTQAELETKLKEHKALPEAERIQLRGKCHVCHKHRCHSDFHLKGTTTRASQIKRTPKDGDTTLKRWVC